MNDLADWRARIDEVDRDIVALLNRRAECVLRLAPLKKQAKIGVLDPSREREVHSNLRAANRGPLPPEAVDKIFDCIMAAMRELQEAGATAE